MLKLNLSTLTIIQTKFSTDSIFQKGKMLQCTSTIVLILSQSDDLSDDIEIGDGL